MEFRVKKEVTEIIEGYIVLRGIRNLGFKKEVVCEKEFSRIPTPQEVGDFLIENRNRIDFCTRSENYRIKKELPFD